MENAYKFLIAVAIFGLAYFIPFDNIRIQKAILESFFINCCRCGVWMDHGVRNLRGGEGNALPSAVR